MQMKFWTAALLFASLAAGQSQGNKPELRIDTGMHTATVWRIAVDSAERYLVSASDERTVRVWRLPSGQLLRTLRPPIGEGNIGRMYSVAITPDGATVVCGGWTNAGGQEQQIYLFDRETGRLIRRIGGLPDVVLHLAYSKDGRYLAAAIAGSNGIRVFRTSDYTQTGEDKEYTDRTYSVDFSNRSPQHLVSASVDGSVRLYNLNPDGSLRLLAKKAAPGGKQPYSAKFSPNGANVAVGFFDSPNVNVLSAADLSWEYAPDAASLSATLPTVAWSADGNVLFAGGTYQNSGVPIVRWAGAGRGTRSLWQAADSTITGLVPLAGGGMAFGSADPALGVRQADGSPVWSLAPHISIYRSSRSHLLVSRDGQRVGYLYEKNGPSPAWFSVKDRTLKTEELPAGQGVAPVTQGLALTDWVDSFTPKLNGKALPLEQYEFSRSAALAPDRRSFLLGTGWHLRRFDLTGKVLWQIPVPDAAWAVNVTGDGQLAVAALADGSIRWYQLDSGKETLAFFPDPDGKRWVLWSPSGYYDASPGGEDLIGWNVNRGPDAAADFFPASRFRSTFYRPDVIARILPTRDEGDAVRLADAEAGRRRQEDSITRMLPPVVTLLSPADGSEFSAASLKVRYSLRNPSGEAVTAVRALVDGRPVAAPRSVVPIVGDTREIEIPVPNHDCEISLIAENRFTAGEPVSMHLKWRGATAFAIQPKLYILAVGISSYRAPYQLGFPAKDARDFVNVLMPQKGKLYRDIEAKLITDAQATKENILNGLEWLERSTTQHDVAMVFLSGHGDNDARSSTYYFMPVNFDPDHLKATAIAQSDILSTVQTLQGKALFFVDSCHSGNVLGGRARTMASDLNAFVNELSSAENGAVVFAASSGRQVAVERDEWGNGAFTKALVEGLNGKAAIGGARITVNMLDLYISERVKQLTNGQQTPTTTKPKTITDFPVAITR